MFDPKYAVVPGIVAASVLLIFLARLVAVPQTAQAATQAVEAATQAAVAVSESECSLSSNVLEGVRRWCAEIEQAAEKYDLDASLIAAVMAQESGGQADVISRSGAVGLMQVMPSDGPAADFQCINGPCFAKRPSTAELLDPAFNLDYGARMLAGLIGRYGGAREALRAYGPFNAGYTYADKVLAIQSRYQAKKG